MQTKQCQNFVLDKRGSEKDNNQHLRLTSTVPVSADILLTILKMPFVQDVNKVDSQIHLHRYKITLGSLSNFAESKEQIIRTLNDFL